MNPEIANSKPSKDNIKSISEDSSLVETEKEESLYDFDQKIRSVRDTVRFGNSEHRRLYQDPEFKPESLQKILELNPTGNQLKRAWEINFESITDLSREKNDLIKHDIVRQLENLLHEYFILHSSWEYKSLEELTSAIDYPRLKEIKNILRQTVDLIINNKDSLRDLPNIFLIVKKLAHSFNKHNQGDDLEKITDLVINIFPIFSKNHESIEIIMDILEINEDVSAEKIFLKYIKLGQKQPPETIAIALTIIVNAWGAEKIRKEINSCIEKARREKETDILENLEFFCSYITPCSDKTAITNLQDFYQENIKFEEYEVNKKMNEKEVSLLKSLMRKDQKILEMGCGTGRLILEMQKAGYDISGFDFTERHVDIVKKENPNLDVFQADWHDTKLSDQSQDVVYSLGRNTSHDYSFIDQVALFREAHRLLKDGGKFIFDTANREKGSYKTMVDGYAEEMKKRGIKNFRYGSIYDSPDGENFATRYVYSHEDIAMLAQLTGFEIKLVKSEHLETDKGDENLYYVLEKK
jgi:SAM-dependent methyltransferase